MRAFGLCGRRDNADENKRLAILTVPAVRVAPVGLRRRVAAGAFVREGDEGGGFGRWREFGFGFGLFGCFAAHLRYDLGDAFGGGGGNAAAARLQLGDNLFEFFGIVRDARKFAGDGFVGGSFAGNLADGLGGFGAAHEAAGVPVRDAPHFVAVLLERFVTAQGIAAAVADFDESVADGDKGVFALSNFVFKFYELGFADDGQPLS